MSRDIPAENKKAWEHLVFDWRMRSQGTPEMLAEKIVASPNSYLRYHSALFNNVSQKRIANICGSDGQRAVALSLLGAQVTVFDLSAPQRDYAIRLATAAKVKIDYVVGDFCELDSDVYANFFDYTYCEGGILHYFHNLNDFFGTVQKILKPGGIMICSDYHPYQKTIIANPPKRNVELTFGDYFDTAYHQGHVPYAKYFPLEIQDTFPSCTLRFYTLSEIFNSVVKAQMNIKQLIEHPRHDNPKIPGEFTLVAVKNSENDCR